MKRLPTAALLLSFGVCSLGSFPVAWSQSTESAVEVDFNRDVMPALSKNCVACHNAKKTEGGLNLESHAALMQGGDSGESILAGDIDGSYLIARVTGAEEPLMPPEDNAVGAKPLTEAEIDSLRRWIVAGAKPPAAESMRALQWQPVPETLQPVYAIATSHDGQYLGYGRGSLVTVTAQQPVADDARTSQALVDGSLVEQLPADSSAPPATHLDIVQSLAFSPDSQRLATGGFRTVKIWRRQTEPFRSLSGLTVPGQVVAVSPNGQWIAQAVGEHGLEITDCRSGEAHRFLRSHAAAVTALAWFPDSPRLLSSDANGQLVITRADDFATTRLTLAAPYTGAELHAVSESQFLGFDPAGKLHELTLAEATDAEPASLSVRAIDGFDTVVAVAVTGQSPATALIALADGRIQAVTAPDWQVVKQLETKLTIKQLSVTADGSRLAVIPAEGAAQSWQLENGQLIAQLDKDYEQVQRLKTSDRNVARQNALIERLAAKVPELQKAAEKEAEARQKVQESRDQAAEALAAQVKQVETAQQEIAAAEQAVADAQAAVAAAMKVVETKTAELEAKKKAMPDIEQKKVAAESELAKREQALATAADSAQRAAARVPELEEQIAGEKNQLVDLQETLKSVQERATQTGTPTAVAISPDATHVVVAGSDQVLRVYSGTQGTPLANVPSAANVRALRITAAGELVCLLDSGVMQAWKLDMPWSLERTIGSFQESPFSDRITALDFSPDGRWLAVGSGPPSRFGDVKLVDVASGAIALDLGEAHSDTVLNARFSPDGRQLATAGADKLCRVFDVATGQLQKALEGHTHHVLGVAWKDDGRTLVTASADATLKVWDVESGTQVRTISGFSKEISAVNFVGQTSQFVVASAEGKAKLYNADNGQAVRDFAGAADALYSIALSAEDQLLYSGGQAGPIWAWQLSDGKLLQTIK